jgi:hypothetical protein
MPSWTELAVFLRAALFRFTGRLVLFFRVLDALEDRFFLRAAIGDDYSIYVLFSPAGRVEGSARPLRYNYAPEINQQYKDWNCSKSSF